MGCLSGSKQKTISVHEKQPSVCRNNANLLCFGRGDFCFRFCLVEAPQHSSVSMRCPPPYSPKYIHMHWLLCTHKCAVYLTAALTDENCQFQTQPGFQLSTHHTAVLQKCWPIYCFIHICIYINVNMLGNNIVSIILKWKQLKQLGPFPDLWPTSATCL